MEKETIMVKHQIHEDFKSFVGTSIPELSKAISDFASAGSLAPKSISVVSYGNQLIAVLGYRSDEASYPVALESVPFGPFNAISDNVDGMNRLCTHYFDAEIETAEETVNSDVICQSLYVVDGQVSIAFLVHVGVATSRA